MSRRGRPKKYKPGVIIGTDKIISRPANGTRRFKNSQHGNKKVQVQCINCGKKRNGNITQNSAKHKPYVSPRCECSYRIRVGATIDNKTITMIDSSTDTIYYTCKCGYKGHIKRTTLGIDHKTGKTRAAPYCPHCPDKPRNSGHREHISRNKAITLLYTNHDFTLESIGKLFDISRERVRQIIAENSPPL